MDLETQLAAVMPTELGGRVARTAGLTVSVAGFPAPVGAVAEIQRQAGPPLVAEVIGFRDQMTLLYPFGDLSGVRHGNRVRLAKTSRWFRVGEELLGRVIDAAGENLTESHVHPILESGLATGSPSATGSRAAEERPLVTHERRLCARGPDRLILWARYEARQR